MRRFVVPLVSLAACVAPPEVPVDGARVVTDVADVVVADSVIDERAIDVLRDTAVDAPLDRGAFDAPRDVARDLVNEVLVDAPTVDAPRDASVEPMRVDVGHEAARDDVVGAGACPADMVALPGFCIDRYEAPNTLGARPLAMQTAVEGARWCAARGRRLCSEAEWVRACQGAMMRAFPYGTSYQRGRCVDDRTWRSPNWTTLASWPSAAAMAEATRLYQADPSGARAGCVSEEGVVDLTGNVAEWVTRSFAHANNYDHVMKGCYWAGCHGGAPPSCAFVNPAHPGTFRTYEAGFRCCVGSP